jgi:hypothetical protein
MNPLYSAHVTITQFGPPRDRSTWRWCLGAVLTIMLAACGGGGGGENAFTAIEPRAAQQLDAKKKAGPGPALVAQPVSMVNTATTGDQHLRAIGALSDGGYTVAWISGTTLYIQRYDSAGNKSGTETALPVAVDPRDTASLLATSSVAVLSDGTVVVAYPARRSSVEPNSPNVTENGVYTQRFDANGVQILPETQLVSLLDGDPRRPTIFETVQVLPMPDGSYVVGWGTFAASATVGSRNSFATQRFDSQNQPVGGVVSIGTPATISAQNRIVADANGGYTAYWFGLAEDFLPTGLTVTHYDANQSPTQILTARPGTALLLPLEDGRYVLYTSDAGAVYRQFLDSAGAPAGERTAVSSMPVSAQLLADGSYIVSWTATGGMTAQRFDASGEPINDMLTIQATGTQPVVAALAEGGFAAAWSAPGASADLDVYTQRFVEVADNQHKACLASAKGLRGQERKEFMTACLP